MKKLLIALGTVATAIIAFCAALSIKVKLSER